MRYFIDGNFTVHARGNGVLQWVGLGFCEHNLIKFNVYLNLSRIFFENHQKIDFYMEKCGEQAYTVAVQKNQCANTECLHEFEAF